MHVSDANLVKIKMLEAFMVGTVEHYHDDNDFGIGESAIPMIIPFTVLMRL